MPTRDLSRAVATALDVDRDAFQERAREEADFVIEELHAGTFDNPQGIVGFEYEFYAVDEEDDSLKRVPRRLLEFMGFEKELGLHNAEMSTSPQPFNAHGLAAQKTEIRARLVAALECTASEGMRLVSDGIWTIPPTGESAESYLRDSVDIDGMTFATNMSGSPRYHAMANTEAADAAAMQVNAPNVTLEADTVMPESLITSIQPHYQIPHARDLPAYFTYALRMAGPLLALSVNSPFFPPDLYDDVPAETILDDAWMEHRIGVFESVLNASGATRTEADEGDNRDDLSKVRFPRDLDSVEEAVERIVTDVSFVPMPIEPASRFDDEFAHFRHKHGTYWRWVRPVFDGATRSAANARIEFRPLPGQPTVGDSVAFQAAVAGLLSRLHGTQHPVSSLDWEVARRNFYRAMRDGLAADFEWVTSDGERTTDTETMYVDLFDVARDGLVANGLSESTAEEYLWPLRFRARHRITPARWKLDRASAKLDDGADLATAIQDTQREYIANQRETLIDGSFADWHIPE